MTDIEPRVYRQRLIMEGHYAKNDVDGETIREYLSLLSEKLDMRIFSGPYSWPPDRWDHVEIELHELNGFVAWTESGCHAYAWRKYRFFTVDIYSCKRFSAEVVLSFTSEYFLCGDIVHTCP